MSFLSETHQKKLKGSGLSLETIGRAQLHTGSVEEVKLALGYGTGGTGLMIPYLPWRKDQEQDFCRVRIDNPGPDGGRYRSPAKSKVGSRSVNRLYVPPTLDKAILEDPSQSLYLTEGELKALKATQEGFATVALPGVWSWKRRVHGKSLTIPDFDYIEWRGRIVVIVFDSDLTDKPPVAWAEHGLVQELRQRGALVYVLRLPSGEKGEKYGLDDYLVEFGADQLKTLPMLSLEEADQSRPVFLRMSDLAEAYLERAVTLHHRIKIGYEVIDNVMRGTAPGEVLTVLGRSGVGKTAFAMNLIKSMTFSKRLPALFFSLEMQGVEVFERAASITIEKTGREIEELATRQHPMIEDEFERVVRDWNHLVIVEKPSKITEIDQLIAEANGKNFWNEPVRLVIIDYLGQIVPGAGKTAYEQVSNTAREVKNVAKRNNVVIILLCQIGREGETGGEPVTLKMGRDSGVIEEAADYVFGIWRPELALGLSVDERAALRNLMRLALLKNRCGPAPRTFNFKWEPELLRITGGEEYNPV